MKGIKYLNQQESIVMDELLMGAKYGLSTFQLMELAGLSCASAISKVYPKQSLTKKVLTIVGPGNNGGDGLVCSRHLVQFGYNVDIFYPKRTDKQLYHDLVLQCRNEEIKFIDELPNDIEKDYSLVIDSIFGYSFKGDIRAPFDKIIESLCKTSTPIASIDVPSGWDVEKGMIQGKNLFVPQLIVSLAAPKLCTQTYYGIHYLGGRFLPRAFIKETNLTDLLPEYKGCDQYVDISISSSPKTQSSL
ncbi:hypothetical protein CYY_003772 [Polysphondylium violaceum]|uniref:NAD(P)H-hydrate epimerase n=1 Tax=Polysphondylium violaceum TaxID=133409 RepID=A0A8J4V8E0_9MYCE|nr:hypothetical protein CYY_003772 [Polysphondylium violaceum]